MAQPITADILPHVDNAAEYDHLIGDNALCRQAVNAICLQHGLCGDSEWLGGSQIVFAIGPGHVIKIFAPIYRDDFTTELIVLDHVHARLPLATPEVYASGEIDGWPYLIMKRLPGITLHRIWPELSQPARIDLCAAIGASTRVLHSLDLIELPCHLGNWHQFLARQQQNCVAIQRERGLGEHWLEQIPAYLDRVGLASQVKQPVLLHTELMLPHLLVCNQQDHWQLTGMVDFEPAMVGANEYDFAAVGIFITAGDPDLFRAFLDGYGYRPQHLAPELSHRIMAYLLLHRYCHLGHYLTMLPGADNIATLEQFACGYYSFDGTRRR